MLPSIQSGVLGVVNFRATVLTADVMINIYANR